MELDAMRDFIKADSLAFISIDGLYRAVGAAQRNADAPQFCDACFSGEYPTSLTDLAMSEPKAAELPFADPKAA
jgi:amidophosphoribosyltransferase